MISETALMKDKVVLLRIGWREQKAAPAPGVEPPGAALARVSPSLCWGCSPQGQRSHGMYRTHRQGAQSRGTSGRPGWSSLPSAPAPSHGPWQPWRPHPPDLLPFGLHGRHALRAGLMGLWCSRHWTSYDTVPGSREGGLERPARSPPSTGSVPRVICSIGALT